MSITFAISFYFTTSATPKTWEPLKSEPIYRIEPLTVMWQHRLKRLRLKEAIATYTI